VYSELVSWLPAAEQCLSALPAVLGVQLHGTQRYVGEPVAQPDAGHHCAQPAGPQSTGFPKPSTGVREPLTVYQPACSVTVLHLTQPIPHKIYKINGNCAIISENIHASLHPLVK